MWYGRALLSKKLVGLLSHSCRRRMRHLVMPVHLAIPYAFDQVSGRVVVSPVGVLRSLHVHPYGKEFDFRRQIRVA